MTIKISVWLLISSGMGFLCVPDLVAVDLIVLELCIWTRGRNSSPYQGVSTPSSCQSRSSLSPSSDEFSCWFNKVNKWVQELRLVGVDDELQASINNSWIQTGVITDTSHGIHYCVAIEYVQNWYLVSRLSAQHSEERVMSSLAAGMKQLLFIAASCALHCRAVKFIQKNNH